MLKILAVFAALVLAGCASVPASAPTSVPASAPTPQPRMSVLSPVTDSNGQPGARADIYDIPCTAFPDAPKTAMRATVLERSPRRVLEGCANPHTTPNEGPHVDFFMVDGGQFSVPVEAFVKPSEADKALPY